MDLRHLRYFVTVAAELHFGRAAQRLNMTQPPLSQAIQALEREVGCALFERSKRHVALTPVGKAWLPHVQALLEGAAALPGIARQLAAGRAGRLRLGFVSTADYSLLPTLVGRYRAAFPAVEIDLREMTSDLQIEALLVGEIDAGLIIAPPAGSLHPSLGYRPLLREPLIAAVPEAWFPGIRGPLAPARLGRAPLILFPRRSAPDFHDIITGYCARHGIAPEIGQEAIQMQTIIALVSAGLGIALVPASLRNLGRAGVRYLKLAGDPPLIETGIAWRRPEGLPALKGFVDLAVQAA